MLKTESRIIKVRKLTQHEGENAKKQELLWDVSDESSDDGFEIQSVTQCQDQNLTINESILDPETGHLDASSGAHWRGWEFKSVPVSQKDDLTFNTPDFLTERGSRFARLKESINSDDILDGDAQISYYIHKKFRKISDVEEPEDSAITKESFMDIALLSQSQDGMTLQLSLKKESTETGKSLRKTILYKYIF